METKPNEIINRIEERHPESKFNGLLGGRTNRQFEERKEVE